MLGPTEVPYEFTEQNRAAGRTWGQALIAKGFDPSVPTVECSRAYLHHLYKMREPLFDTLASIHNLQWMNAKMAETREAILADEI